MPSSKNEAGTRVSSTEHRQAKIIAIQKIAALVHRKKHSGGHANGHFFGRFSAKNRKIRFYIESEHEQEKLDAILTTNPTLFPKITPVDDLEPTTHERLEAVVLQFNKEDSPIKIWRQNNWASPSSLTASRSVRASVEKSRSIKANLFPTGTELEEPQFDEADEISLLDSFDFSEEPWTEFSPLDEDRVSDTDFSFPLDDSVKSVSAIITPDALREAQKNRRQKSTKLFGLSAEAYAALEKTSDGQKRLEFLHLLAHAFEGEFEKNNIVIGSWCANTIMLMYDSAAKKLLEQHGCTEIKVSIQCSMQPKIEGIGYTAHALKIKMIYETDTGFIFHSPLIDANTETRPTTAECKGIGTIIVNSYLASKQTKNLHSLSQPLSQTPASQPEEGKEDILQQSTSLFHVGCTFFGSNTPVTPTKISVPEPLPFRPKFG